MNEYAELHVRSAFSFLRGASLPETLAARAAALEIPALALCDRGGVYGAPRLHTAAKETGIRAITGAELEMDCGCVLPVLVRDRAGWQNLCRLLTQAKLRGTKDHAPVRWNELAEFAAGLVALTGDGEGPVRRALERGDRTGAAAAVRRLTGAFGEDSVYVEVQRHLRRGEERELDALKDLALASRLPMLATGGVLYAVKEERPLLDVFTCARNHTHLDAAGRLLCANAVRCLKSPAMMVRLFKDMPEAVLNTVRLAERLEFSLKDLGYEFPRHPVPEGQSMDSVLREAAFAGARGRWGNTLSVKQRKQLEHELELIARLGFSGYFLIVWDIVNFCKKEDILVQGRGSAANSAVCYALGITACDPVAGNLLFERFLSEGRTSWPDIDLDLPSGERRERVIQEVYRRHGKHGAAMTANVITFRGKSAMREIGKALNLPPEMLDRFSSLFAGGDFPHTIDLRDQLRQAGLPETHPRMNAAVELYKRIYGIPRHLGQHSGGMSIAQGNLSGVVPIENASMPGRTVAQWDKDDCDGLGIIKVDLLGLGMMSAMQDTLALCAERGRPVDLAHLPMDDAATFDAMCRADTIGVFQIESRAQMATLPRMRPRCFYDVAVEVAIIRPGPIQGDMLHPYLARRTGREPVTYYDDKLIPVLERTLGVPLFQEQLLKMAMVMANFSGSEAEELRRALSYHRSPERMEKVCEKLRAGMAANGVRPGVIEEVIRGTQSFAAYGFPESHAISFALIAYASMWLKVHRAPEFVCSLLNNQPMGFYSAATLVRDAKAHGIKVRAVDVMKSDWRCTVAEDDSVRLGLCLVRGMRREQGEHILSERERREFSTIADFQLRTRLSQAVRRTLAETGALNSLSAHRRTAQWEIELPRTEKDLFASAANSEEEEVMPLAMMTPHERLRADYAGTGVTVGPHPLALLRADLPGVTRSCDLVNIRHGAPVTVAGMVICRQRPGTAHGFVFLSLEDETGICSVILKPAFFERHRLTVTQERFLQVTGSLQRGDGGVIHIMAGRIKALMQVPRGEAPGSHDFH